MTRLLILGNLFKILFMFGLLGMLILGHQIYFEEMRRSIISTCTFLLYLDFYQHCISHAGDQLKLH